MECALEFELVPPAEAVQFKGRLDWLPGYLCDELNGSIGWTHDWVSRRLMPFKVKLCAQVIRGGRLISSQGNLLAGTG